MMIGEANGMVFVARVRVSSILLGNGSVSLIQGSFLPFYCQVA